MSRPWKIAEVQRLWDRSKGKAWEIQDARAPQLETLISAGWVKKVDGRCGFELLKDAMLAWTEPAKAYFALVAEVGAWTPIENAVPVANKSLLVATSDTPPVVGEAWWKEEGDRLELWWCNTGPGDYHSDPISQSNSPVTHCRPLPSFTPTTERTAS